MIRATGTKPAIIAGDLLGHADGVFGDVGPELAQADVVGVVEHAAVGVAAPVDEVLARLLGGRRDHDRAVELLGQDRGRRLPARNCPGR